MRHIEASTYTNDWQYRQAQKQERKQDRQRREQRRGRKSQWNIKGDE